MTPAARHAAAIGVLDKVLTGQPAEKALTNWARGNRYAGSGDRLAVRDLVFDALRCMRSFAHLGGGMTGRGIILGGLRAAGTDPAQVFTGEGYAPAALTDAEASPVSPPEGLVALDCPDWLAPLLQTSLGPDFAPVLTLLQQRAPLFLRVNSIRATPDQALAALSDAGIEADVHPLSPNALVVRTNPRKVQTSQPFLDGLVEVQDAASQALVDLLPLVAGQKVLDYCAGGGGKSLAMAARCAARYFAHDADVARMQDLPPRAARAGAKIRLLTSAEVAAAAPFDLVLLDVPCSGSGSWRRAPEAKWALSAERLAELCRIQSEILSKASAYVAPGGVLAYATCSLLAAENAGQIADFLASSPGWRCENTRRFTPLEGGDGFFLATMRRAP